MPPSDPNHQEIYQTVLNRLRELGATVLVEEIERTVAQGVVLTGQQTEISKNSSIYRAMQPQEALAVALEFFLTALDVPVMHATCRSTLESAQIQWRNERPGTQRDDVINDVSEIDVPRLQQLLERMIRLVHDLGINMPEIA